MESVNGGGVPESMNGEPATARLSVGTAQGVWKAFGETQALRDISLDVRSGECHALVGRNGAGKSTLVAILTGLVRPDRGIVRLGAEAAPPLADRATWQRLVACVYQKSMVVPTLTVAENVFLNRTTGSNNGLVNWHAMRSQARQIMLEWGFDLDVNRLAGNLTVEQRQVVEIARALSIGARFLILDEPTASLEKAAIQRLFERVRRLRETGVGILYISHHLEEIYAICDELTVLRDGRLVLHAPVAEVSQEQLVAAMVGSPLAGRSTEIVAERAEAGAPCLSVRGLRVVAAEGAVDSVDLTVSEGECVGLVGLHGSGSTTVADAIVGLVRPDAGEIELKGRPLGSGRVDATLREGVGYVPQDRHARGLVPMFGVGNNLTLTVLDRVSRWGIVSRQAEQAQASLLVAELEIVATGLEQPVSSLSGGNQQKVVVGRALARDPALLVA